MKKQVLIIAIALATLAGCTSNLEPVPTPQGEGIFATIEQPALPFQTKSFSWDNNALKFTWGSGENVVVFGREGNRGKSDAALLRTLTSGAASSKLESKGFQLMDGINYYAFIPAYNFVITSDFRSIPMTFEGQRQDVKNSTAMLKYYDYACAKATKASGANSLEFNLKNQVGWIVVEHLFTEETKGVTSLTLSTTDPLFTSSCTLDATTSTISGNKYSTSLTLTLGTANGAGFDFDKGEFSRAFFTTAPVDLSDKELTITAHKADGTSVVLLQKTLSGCNIQKNGTVIIKTESAKTFKSVASINGRQFGSIEEAIAFALNTKNHTITLESDINGPLTITNTLPRHAELILDLNGHSITSENEGECAVIVKQGEVRLKNGTIDSKKFVGVKLDSHAKGAKIYLNDCTVKSVQGAVCTGTASGCYIYIYGGSFTATNNAVIAGNGSINYVNTTEARDKGNTISIESSKSGIPVINGYTANTADVACGIYAPWKDNITIKAAKFNIENGVGILSRGGNIVINDAEIITTGGDRIGKVADSKTDVPCKTVYIDKACNYPALENAAITIYGGKYSDDAGKDYVAPKYYYEETNETPLAYKVSMASTNEIKLIDAVSSVEKNGTVLVDYPVAPKSQLKIQKDFTLTMANGVLMEGDLSDPILHFCQDNGTNVINGNGTIRGGQNSDGTILVNGKGQTLTIDSKDIRIEGGNSSEFAAAIMVWDGKLVINDGTFVSGTDKNRNDSPAIYLMPMDQYDHAELEINGGTFKTADGASTQYLINCHDGSIADCKITIKGGTFVGFNPAASTGDTINGKPANWVAEGYESVESTENPGTWIVRKKN